MPRQMRSAKGGTKNSATGTWGCRRPAKPLGTKGNGWSRFASIASARAKPLRAEEVSTQRGGNQCSAHMLAQGAE